MRRYYFAFLAFEVVAAAGAFDAATSAFESRLILRAALFLCIRCFVAALAKRRSAAKTSSFAFESLVEIAIRAFFNAVRS